MSPQHRSRSNQNHPKKNRGFYSRNSKEARKSRQNIESILRANSTEAKPVLFAFVDATSDKAKLNKAQKLEKTTNLKSRRIAGEMFIEIASRVDNLEQRAKLISKAEANWEIVLRHNDQLDNDSLRSSIQLAHSPMYHDLLLFEQTSSLANTEQTYSRLLKIADQCSDAIKSNNLNPRTRAGVIGASSELAVLLLLQRFTLHSENDEWTILPSFLSEDTGENPNANPDGLLRSWDVSVFSQYFGNIPPDLNYKLQIKTSRSKDSCYNYSPDITVVHLLQDLDLRDPANGMRSGFLVQNILDELCLETYASDARSRDFAQRTLDLRTEKLLDIMG